MYCKKDLSYTDCSILATMNERKLEHLATSADAFNGKLRNFLHTQNITVKLILILLLYNIYYKRDNSKYMIGEEFSRFCPILFLKNFCLSRACVSSLFDTLY